MRDDFENRLREAFGMGFEDSVGHLPGAPRIYSDGGSHLEDRLQTLMDCLTTVGAEVSRLRAEMDGLLEANSELRSRLAGLQEVIEEKSILDIEEFELACDVVEAENAEMEMERGLERDLNFPDPKATLH